MNSSRNVARIAIPFLILALGALVFVAFVATKPEAEPQPPPDRRVLVDVMVAKKASHNIAIHARGNVIPAREVQIQPQINGRITWLSDKLVPGAHIRKGDLLARIEGQEYRLALESQRAQLQKAEVDLQLEQGRKAIAEKEWQLFSEDNKIETDSPKQQEDPEQPDQEVSPAADATTSIPPAKGLALRKPQLRAAQAALKAAASSLKRSQLDLNRTALKSPFNAIVREKNVDLGQLVTPQNVIATLIGSDTYWAKVGVPVNALAWIHIPGINGHQQGASVLLEQRFGSTTTTHRGRVLQLLGELDTKSRMATLLVAIDKPASTTKQSTATEKNQPSDHNALPLLIGAYVDVAIDVKPLEGVIRVPREALRDGEQVYIMSKKDRLLMRDVNIVWRDDAAVYVSEGLREGDLIITSSIGSPTDNMPLRREKSDKPKTKATPGQAKRNSLTPNDQAPMHTRS